MQDDTPEPENRADPPGRAGPLVSCGYLARNLDVANAYGLNAGLVCMRKRMQTRKDCPAWLLQSLDEMIHRSNCLIRPLVEHRDDLANARDVRG
jgi:hypothetical protein